ncbi:hypothetical protein MUB24_00125 [Lederbergia sp. NSJ-179]|uniref:DUF5027 family lipoprotein n=1 Tax=Lederbergia sp. NSJ-179 TaxID=2931402 RepID=UPI001FD1BC93|nr:hypothetical protein [Lederbergia sp. NSJ-179]MCJ7839333.1 hypothetical protein [Lederbergia sp. NSJ-179]
MKKMKGITILFFCVLPIFLSACSYREFEDSLKSKLNKEEDEYSNPAKIVDESSEDEEQGPFSVGDTITYTEEDIQTDTKQTIEYTLNKIHVSDNINDLGLNVDDFTDKSLIADNGDIKKKNRLVTVDVTVKNISHQGYDSEADDPILFIESSVGFKEGIEDPNGPWTLEESYFSEHPPLDQNNGQDYSQFPLPIGDEIDVTVGWFVPADQLKNQPLYYIIGQSGLAEDYEYFELKFE